MYPRMSPAIASRAGCGVCFWSQQPSQMELVLKRCHSRDPHHPFLWTRLHWKGSHVPGMTNPLRYTTDIRRVICYSLYLAFPL